MMWKRKSLTCGFQYICGRACISFPLPFFHFTKEMMEICEHSKNKRHITKGGLGYDTTIDTIDDETAIF